MLRTSLFHFLFAQKLIRISVDADIIRKLVKDIMKEHVKICADMIHTVCATSQLEGHQKPTDNERERTYLSALHPFDNLTCVHNGQ